MATNLKNHIVLNLYSLRKTPYILLLLIAFCFYSFVFSPDSVDPYNPEQIRHKLNLALNNAQSEPDKSYRIIEESIALAEKSKDRPTVHVGYITKGKYFLLFHQYDEALLAFNQAYINAMESGIELQMLEAVRLLSEIHIVKDFKNESLEYLYKGLNLSQMLNNHEGMAWYLIQIPDIEFAVGNIVPAMKSAIQAKEYFESQQDTVGKVQTLLLMGKIYNRMGNLSTSRKHVEHANSLIKDGNYPLLLGATHEVMAEILVSEKKYYDAEVNLKKAIAIVEPLDSKEFNRLKSFLGELMTLNKKYHEANTILHEVLKSQKGLSDIAGTAHTHYRIANLHRLTHQPQQAVGAFNSCIEHANSIGLNDLLRLAYKGLSQVLGEGGNHREAYLNLLRYTRITDSLFNAQVISEASKVEEKAILNQQQQEMLIKEMELKKGKELISQQKQKQTLLILVIVLFFVIIVFVVMGFIHNRRDNLVLATQKGELEKQKSIAESRTRELTDSMNYARYIQQAILRASLSLRTSFPESFIVFIPRDIVSGDFYWSKEKNGRILFALADCTGHGVPGALMSIVGTYGLNNLVSDLNIANPGEILNRINYIFEDSIEQQKGFEIFDGMDIAFCSYNPKSRELKYAGANIPLYIIRSSDLPQPSNTIVSKGKNHALYQIRPNKQSIGSHIETVPFVTHSVTLIENDIIYLFSDGFADQFGGPDGRKFMTGQLYKLICDLAVVPLSEHKKNIEETFYSWKGNGKQVDDVSFIGIKICGDTAKS